MYSFKTLITIFAAITPALSLPSPNLLDKRVDPHAQSCTAKDQGLGVASYTVIVGEPYNSGSGCGAIYNALEYDYSVGISAWRCDDDGAGGTILKFNAVTNIASRINPALHEMYPQVNGFNCPDY